MRRAPWTKVRDVSVDAEGGHRRVCVRAPCDHIAPQGRNSALSLVECAGGCRSAELGLDRGPAVLACAPDRAAVVVGAIGLHVVIGDAQRCQMVAESYVE